MWHMQVHIQEYILTERLGFQEVLTSHNGQNSIILMNTYSASAGVGICLANLAKDHIFLYPNENLFSIFFNDRN